MPGPTGTVLWVGTIGDIAYHEERRRFLDKAVAEFTAARAAFPENRIIGMYLGTPIPAEPRYTDTWGAPQWAAWQREGLERLADIDVWWIDNRLQDNGAVWQQRALRLVELPFEKRLRGRLPGRIRVARHALDR